MEYSPTSKKLIERQRRVYTKVDELFKTQKARSLNNLEAQAEAEKSCAKLLKHEHVLKRKLFVLS